MWRRNPGHKSDALKSLIRSALGGDITAAARLITLAEAGGETALEVQNGLFPHTGRAHLLGITGPAGVGKSTLISKLAAKLAAPGQKVAVIACDPSSPKTGGALLGDRIRMNNLTLDERIFIRSIATRENNGSLPLAALRAADILDASGFGAIIIETVGTGQNQVDIMQAAHTIIAVSAPGLGDDIQAMKSGLLEVADIHVVSKSDLGGAGKTLTDIENAIHMRQGGPTIGNGTSGWKPVVLPVSSLEGEGFVELKQAIETHYEFLMDGSEMQRRSHHMLRMRIYREAMEILEQSFKATPGEHLSRRIEQVLLREITPTKAAQEMLKDQL
jgi:LAO/AO transport system kinase